MTTQPSGSAARPLCILNGCYEPQGVGTWCRIAGREQPQPVCESHWQALRGDDRIRRERVAAQIEAALRYRAGKHQREHLTAALHLLREPDHAV